MEPQTFELSVAPGGEALPGAGILVAVVPSSADAPAVVAIACDPACDPGHPVGELAPAVIRYIQTQINVADEAPRWAVIDAWGRFNEAVPSTSELTLEGQAPGIELRRFPDGISIEAFYKATGVSGEAAIELLSSLLEKPRLTDETPTEREFLEAVETHGNLPAPGAIFQKVEAAATEGDVRLIANAIQPDPVISASLINSANAARFANAGKTGSVPQAVSRLGTSFVRRVVFVAEMMARYQKGVCPAFDYRGYWMNAIATGAAMRALVPNHGISPSMADEAFTTGLVSGIGWLAVAETFPALMTKYLERCQGADPVTKARAQNEIFPCPIRRVAERYLERFEFPEIISSTVAGKPEDHRNWYDCLAQATRVAQVLSPFECVAVPSTLPVPEACVEEWERWKVALAGG